MEIGYDLYGTIEGSGSDFDGSPTWDVKEVSFTNSYIRTCDALYRLPRGYKSLHHGEKTGRSEEDSGETRESWFARAGAKFIRRPSDRGLHTASCQTARIDE